MLAVLQQLLLQSFPWPAELSVSNLAESISAVLLRTPVMLQPRYLFIYASSVYTAGLYITKLRWVSLTLGLQVFPTTLQDHITLYFSLSAVLNHHFLVFFCWFIVCLLAVSPA